MATIKDHLNNILQSVFGRDVRQSIHDAIQQCYNDATGNPESIAAYAKKVDDAVEYINGLPVVNYVDGDGTEPEGALIYDNVETGSKTWSSKKIRSELDTVVENAEQYGSDAEKNIIKLLKNLVAYAQKDGQLLNATGSITFAYNKLGHVILSGSVKLDNSLASYESVEIGNIPLAGINDTVNGIPSLHPDQTVRTVTTYEKSVLVVGLSSGGVITIRNKGASAVPSGYAITFRIDYNVSVNEKAFGIGLEV